MSTLLMRDPGRSSPPVQIARREENTCPADTVNAVLRKYLRVERMVEITAGTFPREREGAGSN
ncbi:hypothetical protein SRS16CHR_02630 [Variovorax sp. SRS16]|nr:hypothetical protein SRS16CHR_02630 [Variovorax sp. SRS16]